MAGCTPTKITSGTKRLSSSMRKFSGMLWVEKMNMSAMVSGGITLRVPAFSPSSAASTSSTRSGFSSRTWCTLFSGAMPPSIWTQPGRGAACSFSAR
ncbi:hypothetical protein D3C72_1736340 [compost metagenome]